MQKMSDCGGTPQPKTDSDRLIYGLVQLAKYDRFELPIDILIYRSGIKLTANRSIEITICVRVCVLERNG